MFAKNFLISHFRTQQVLVLSGAGLACERTEAVKCGVRALANAARKRIGYKRPVKKWAEEAADGMVQKTVAHARLMDIPRLRVADIERLISAVAVGMIYQIGAEGEKIVH